MPDWPDLTHLRFFSHLPDLHGVQWIDSVQWFAFAASVAAAWLVASPRSRRRNAGFWLFMLSNLLWIAWGLHADAKALIALQVCLAAMNIRGLANNQPEKDEPERST